MGSTAAKEKVLDDYKARALVFVTYDGLILGVEAETLNCQ